MSSDSEPKRVKLDLSQVLGEQLKCYNCESGRKVCKYHWFRCNSFHMLCPDCRELRMLINKNCICGKPMQLEHCPMIEALLHVDKMKFKCENLPRGCHEMSDEENMTLHETECIYRLVKCPSTFCGSEVPFHDLIDHMKKKKDFNKMFKTKTQEIVLSKIQSLSMVPDFYPIMFDIDSKLFFSILKVKEGAIYHWVHLVGSPFEAKNFSYVLEYPHEGQVSVKYFGQVMSVNEAADSIIEKGNCLGIPRKLFETKYMDQERNFKYLVTITNLKEEVKDDNVESGISDDEEEVIVVK